MKKKLKQILDFGYGLIPGSSIFQRKEVDSLRERLKILQGNEDKKNYDLQKSDFALIDSIISLSCFAGGLDTALNEIPVLPFFFFGSYIGAKELMNYANRRSIKDLKGSIGCLEGEMIDEHTQKNKILKEYQDYK